ncbi:MAG: tetratricopeptide repeat protein [Bacteroidia bacterium]
MKNNSQKTAALSLGLQGSKEVKKKTNWLWHIAGITVLTIIVYLPSLQNLFTNWDDPIYVTDNILIRNLSLPSIKSYFCNYVAGNYHPLTMLSLAINYNFSGLSPGFYHITNLFIHICNALLVYVFIKKLTGDIRIAAITSLLFAIHPLHVESVAWVSERKDVLYAFFYFSALCVYLNYVKAPAVKLYFTVIILYILSLLSKAMAVTLPLVLLLLDYYKGRKPDSKAIFEKIPFIALSFIFGIIAVYAQQTANALEVKTGFSYFDRILFAGYGITAYLWKFLFPFHLSCFYDYPVKTNGYFPFIFYLSPLLVMVLAFFVYKSFRNNKDVVFAFLFFIFTIILVLQLIPVGNALYADRYTYIPYIGLFFLAGKGIVLLIESNSRRIKKIRPWLLYALGAIALFFSCLTYLQCRVWKNDLTLWTSAINNSSSALAYCSRGKYYMENNKNDDAVTDYNKAIDLRDDYSSAYLDRSSLLLKMGIIDKALDDCNKFISLSHDNIQESAFAYINKGKCLIVKKNYSPALAALDKAIQINPGLVPAFYFKGGALYCLGKYEEAINAYTKAIEINPEFKEAYYSRSNTFFAEKEYALALTDALKAKELGYNVNDRYIEMLNEHIKRF